MLSLMLALLACSSSSSSCFTVADVEPPPAWDPAALNLYDDATNPFEQPIGADPTLHPESALLATSLQSEFAQAMLVAVGYWTVPVYLADESTPVMDVPLGRNWGASRILDVPVPPWAVPDPEGDGSMAIIDTSTHLEYDFWETCNGPDGLSASWGGIVRSDGNGVFPHGLSARGSGFALMNGLIWPHELAAGRIEHALLFSYNRTRAGGPVAPATESDGTGNGDNNIPEGARIQLDPTLDLSTLGLEPWQETIARAMQEYGMILGDDGGGLQLYAVNPASFPEREAAYDGLISLEDGYAYFPADFPVDRFRVLDYGPQNANAQEELAFEFPERFE